MILLALLGTGLSGLLLLDHYEVGSAAATVDQLCGEGEASGCDEVSRSRYSSVAGVSLAAVGLFFYTSLLFLLSLALVTSNEVRRAAGALALLGVAIALVTDLILLGLQAFAIGAFCWLCIATYAVNLVALLVLLPSMMKVSTLLLTLFGGEGRLAITVWTLGSLVLLASVGAVELVLAEAEKERQDNPLGIELPSPETVPETETESLPQPDASPAIEQQLEKPVPGIAQRPAGEKLAAEGEGQRSREEIRRLEKSLTAARGEIQRLQQILDDPKKYQEYHTEKAAQEFEQEKREDLAFEGIPFKGPGDAPIRVVEYADFLCGPCRSLAGALSNYLPRSDGRVSVHFKNYPLDQACNPGLSRNIHPGACELALGGICAEEQEQFWLFHDSVFSESPRNPAREDVVRIGIQVGLDEAQLRKCLDSPEAEQKLTAVIEEAKRIGVTSTPTVFVNGKRLRQLNGFLKAVESESKRLGLSGSP